jgi:hypothetical protein
MATGMYIWHAPHSRRVVREDVHKEGWHLPEWTYTGPMRMLLIYFTNISKLCVWYVIISIYVYFMLTHRRGWRRIYPVIQPPRRASQNTRCIRHQTTRMSRWLGRLSTLGGFGRLGRTLLLFVWRVSRTGLAHKGHHLRAHLGIRLKMTDGCRKCRRWYKLNERGMMSWSSACDSSRPSCPLWEYHLHVLVLSSLHLQT